MTLWLTRSGKHCEHEQKFLDEGRIYLTWGGLNRDLGRLRDRADLSQVMAEVYPAGSHHKRKNHINQVWGFAHGMMVGDWIASPSKRKTIHIGEITGPYKFVPSAANPYFHYRAVNWLERDIPRTNFDQDILHSLGAFLTVCRIERNDAESRVRAMQSNEWRSADLRTVGPARGGLDGDGADTEGADDIAAAALDLEQIGRDHIARHIYSRYAGHGLEELVEAILIAQGFTTHRSDKGADGGIDILAAPDTLGFGRPRICVQVKSQTSPLERPVFDQLVGTMQHVGADQGLLVCWGGFKPTIHRVAPQNFFKVRLWDQNDLIDHFLANYDKFDEDLRTEIPLKRVWTVANAEAGERE